MDAPPRSDGVIALTLVFADGAVEEDDVIGRVRLWALRTAFVETGGRAFGNEDPPPHVGVSLAARGPVDPQLVQAVRRTLAATDTEPRGVTTVEISETNVMADPAHTARILRRLRDLGLAVAVDDAGTAHSSLLYIPPPRPHPLDVDAAPLAGVIDAAQDVALVGLVSSLAQQLSARAQPDAAEAREPRNELAWIGGDHGQGLQWSPALTEREVNRWLRAPRGSA